MLLIARKQLQAKMGDMKLSLRGLLRHFGLKVDGISKGQYAERVRAPAAAFAMLERVADAMVRSCSCRGVVQGGSLESDVARDEKAEVHGGGASGSS